jgi:hypothetical protein
MGDSAKPCPKCGCPDPEVDSCAGANASWVECHNCEFRIQKRTHEEGVIKHWNKISRLAMPVYDEEAIINGVTP